VSGTHLGPLLIENPIGRYFVNSRMLSGMKKNSDGSLTLHVRKNSPGKLLESNWLLAGCGDWKPPGIVAEK
jgi:hypothetical protein